MVMDHIELYTASMNHNNTQVNYSAVRQVMTTSSSQATTDSDTNINTSIVASGIASVLMPASSEVTIEPRPGDLRDNLLSHHPQAGESAMVTTAMHGSNTSSLRLQDREGTVTNSRAAKQKESVLRQKEREALGEHARVSIIAAEKEKLNYEDPEMKESRARVNALLVCERPPALAMSDVWTSFRKYTCNSKRENYAVCTLCLNEGKLNWDAEVCYGFSHSTSKLDQHLKSKHASVHKRKIETRVEDDRKNGINLLTSLNVVYGGAAVNHYIEWIVQEGKPIDTCESESFRAMISSLNAKSPLATLTKKTVATQVCKSYTRRIIYCLHTH